MTFDTAPDIDAIIGLTFYSALSNELAAQFPKMLFPGIGQVQADKDTQEWLAVYLLNADTDARVQTRKGDEGRFGQIQVSCFSRFFDRAKNDEHDRPWKIANAVRNKFRLRTMQLTDENNQIIGTLKLDNGRSVYVDESQAVRGEFAVSPSNVHAVVITFGFSAFSNYQNLEA